MCRNIKTLFNFEPPATELEIRDASLQFVRKLSGFSVPSQANTEAFDLAVAEVAAVARTLIASLVTSAEPRNREVEAERACHDHASCGVCGAELEIWQAKLAEARRTLLGEIAPTGSGLVVLNNSPTLAGTIAGPVIVAIGIFIAVLAAAILIHLAVAGQNVQFLQQREDLGLDRHVQRGGRFVGDQEVRLAGQRHRDHHPLFLPAGQAERVVVDAPLGLGDAHAPQPVQRLGPRRRAAQRRVGLDRLDDRLDARVAAQGDLLGLGLALEELLDLLDGLRAVVHADQRLDHGHVGGGRVAQRPQLGQGLVHQEAGQDHAERARQKEDADLEKAMGETVEAEIHAMPVRKREKLTAELERGGDIEYARV